VSDLLVFTQPRDQPPVLDDRQIGVLAARLQPDGVTHRPPTIWRRPGMTVVITDPLGTEGEPSSFRLGGVPSADGSWFAHVTGSMDDHRVEVANDAVGSRTVWVGESDGVTVASTSLRAAVFAFGSFQFDPRGWAWMLPSGSLGPSWSWDQRLQQLPGRSAVELRPDVQPRISSGNEEASSPGQGMMDLDGVLRATVGEIRPGNEWILPLSGGVDSRSLASLLPQGMRTVTWGTIASKSDPVSDTAVAEALASLVGSQHEFLPLDAQPVPSELVFERFVRASEGRVDHFSGYVDGFALWRRLRDHGVAGVLRGDQMFGWRPMPNEFAARRSLDVAVFDDVSNLRPFAEEVRIEWSLDEAKHRPRGTEESLAHWRDTLQREARAPSILAALTQSKSGYVEVVNPLLARLLVDYVVAMPDRSRTDKRALRRWVKEHSPSVPFAQHSSLLDPRITLGDERLVEEMRAALSAASSRFRVPPSLTEAIEAGLRIAAESTRSKASLRRRLVPRRLARWAAYRDPRLIISANRLGFRILLGVRAAELFSADAAAKDGLQPGGVA
jgi:asparagine synthetase B (glutamine-hydrolysing)